MTDTGTSEEDIKLAIQHVGSNCYSSGVPCHYIKDLAAAYLSEKSLREKYEKELSELKEGKHRNCVHRHRFEEAEARIKELEEELRRWGCLTGSRDNNG